MIPQKLEMENFLAYQSPPPIDFTGINLACLTGHNGAGKSSIFDAITFALWGKARSKRDEDMVHQGKTEMRVTLDFQHDGQRYRVTRKRSVKEKRSKGTLDLYTSPKAGGYVDINENSVRATQVKLNEILCLDYETFVNSAYFKQGEADSFAVKMPSERKQILFDILNLGQWAKYDDEAKDKAAEEQRKINLLQHDYDRLTDETGREGELRSVLAVFEQDVGHLQRTVNTKVQELEQVAKAGELLNAARDYLGTTLKGLQAFQDVLGTADDDITSLREEIERYHNQLAKADQIEMRYANLIEAREQEEAFRDKQRQVNDIVGLQTTAKQAIESERQKIRLDTQALTTRQAECQAMAAGAEGISLLEYDNRIAEAKALKKDSEALADEIQRLKTDVTSTERLAEHMRYERDDIRKGIQNWQLAEDGQDCPSCGRPLDMEHRRSVIKELEDSLNALRERYGELGKQKESARETLALKEWEKGRLDKTWRNPDVLMMERDQAEQKLLDAERAGVQLEQINQDLVDKQRMLDEDGYAHASRQQLIDLENEYRALGYDTEAHKSIMTRLSALKGAEPAHAALELARDMLPKQEEALTKKRAMVKRIMTRIAEDKEKLSAIEIDITGLETRAGWERELRKEVNELRGKLTKAREDIAVCNQELSVIESAKGNLQRISQSIKACKHVLAIFNELRTAFGKNGVPAFIVETAIPELEAEANDLLDRMTDGRMALRLHTEREKQDGGTIETLDIEIEDELGARSYAMYSGGEAFRINLALRIAISKLLARRSGAQLRALFIDEGFGTQDEEGRNKLVESISRISDQFDMILCITHIEELRDSFPVHLVVEKTSSGSKVVLQSA